jgi:hypothetical protein
MDAGYFGCAGMKHGLININSHPWRKQQQQIMAIGELSRQMASQQLDL